MRITRTILMLTAACVFACALFAQDQPAPSLGDIARRARLEKQQREAEAAKDSAAKDAAAKSPQSSSQPSKDDAETAEPKIAKRVITNDEIPEHVGPTVTNPTTTTAYPQPQPVYGAPLGPAEAVRAQMLQQKNYIASLESQIKAMSDSIQYDAGDHIRDAARWNATQEYRRQQVEMMKTRLEQMRKSLSLAQEMLRKQGYSSSVYDP